MKVEGEQLFDTQDKGYLNRPLELAPGMVKIMCSIAMFLLTINPIFIPKSWLNGIKTG